MSDKTTGNFNDGKMLIFTRAPEDPLRWLDDAPDKHEGWVGILFLKCGRAINGTTIYPSEEDVQKAAKIWEADTEMKRGERDDIWCGHPAAQFWYSEYSHVIAMPVKEKP